MIALLPAARGHATEYTFPTVLERGFIVAFVGVDGSGKSSIVRALLRDARFDARRIRRLYLGSNEFWIPGALWLNARLASVPGIKYVPRCLLRIDRQLRLGAAVYYRWRGHLVVCDRYFFDDIVATRQATSDRRVDRLKRWLRPRMLRRPDLTFYLDVSPETAYARKQDYAFDTMLRVNRAYREEMALHPNVVFIDAEQPEVDVQRDVVAHIQRLQSQSVRTPTRTLAAVGKRVTRACLARRGPRRFGEWLVVHSRRWHPRVTADPAEVRARLAMLARHGGPGTLSLTGSGALQHRTSERVRAVALGAVAERSLAANYRQWTALRTGPHAALVDYECARDAFGDAIVYATERLERRRPTWADVDAVLDQLRGTFRSDQFEGMSFDAARSTLVLRAGLRPADVSRFEIHAEPGFHGIVHGDLHAGNLLLNTAGRFVLIDLDRVQQGAQVLDRIHCGVVHMERQRRRHWLAFFSSDPAPWSDGQVSRLLRDVTPNSLRAYFLWRQSIELANPVPDRAIIRRLRACCDRLVRAATAGR